MAWDRRVELSIGADPSSNSALLISGLDIDFKINRSTVFIDNTAEFTVYNASETTRKEVLVEGANIIFKAGYEDSGVGTIFIGCITKAISGKAGADWVTAIRASSLRGATKPLDASYMSLSYTVGTLISAVLADIGAAMGLVVTGAENASVTLPNGFAFAGRVRDALSWCSTALRAQGRGLYIDNGEIVVYMAGKESSIFTALYLTYDSGLLSVKDTTEDKDVGFVPRARSAGAIVAGDQPDAEPKPAKTEAGRQKQAAKAQAKKEENPPAKRIQFDAVLIPKAQPNSVLKIKTDSVNGSYIVDTLLFEGNNYGGKFNVSGEASAPV